MDDGRWIMDDELSLPMGKFIFLYILCSIYSQSVSLQIATLARNTLRGMVVGDARQTTPVQITHVLALCCFTQIKHVHFDSCKNLTC